MFLEKEVAWVKEEEEEMNKKTAQSEGGRR